jgi:hypothetical protein
MSCEAKQKTVSLIFFLIFYLFLLCTASCNTTEPPDPPVTPEPILKLELEDVSCTEAWITLTTTDLILPAELTLKQYNSTGDSISKALILNTQDTLLYIDSLFPNQTYEYLVSSIPQSGGQNQATSNELSVTTMDTTSHNFTFQSWTFGTIGSSVLYDVAIIDENNIIAVGEIMVADSSPNGYTTYNAVHWDGNHWELLRIPYRDFGNHIVYGPLRTVLAFSDSDIWFCSYADLVHYNGSNYSSKAFFMTGSNFNGQVSKMWGTEKNNIYCVGRSGAIYHYNGTSWKKIESGTDIDINDVWGIIDPITNSRKVFCAVSFVLQLGEHKILTLDENNKVDSIPWNTGRRVGSVWTSDGKKFYTGGGGVFQNKSGNWNEETSIPLYYTNRVRGNGLNDVFVGGDFGLLAHFNGVEWKVYQEFLFSASSLSITVSQDIIAAVGRFGERALIILGKRN